MSPTRHLRPAILDALPLDRHAVIEASAGTGKTYTLEHLVVELLLRTEARIEQILIVTFTERATAELKRRIRGKLESLLGPGDAPEDVPDAKCWLLDGPAKARIQAALSALDAAPISTIHGFCQRILGEQAFASGRLFGEEQVDAQTAFHRAFTDVARGELARDPAQAERLRAWLEAGKKMESLELLAFDALKERGQLRPVFDEGAFLARCDAFSSDAGMKAALAIELKAGKKQAKTIDKILDLVDALQSLLESSRPRGPVAMLGALKSWHGGSEGPGGWLSGILLDKDKAVLPGAQIERLLALVGQASRLESATIPPLLPPIRARLAQTKREQGLFDFDDMLVLVRDALADPVRGPGLTEVLRGRFLFALVDEFQDTDEVQWEIFRRIFGARAEGRVLYVIGDPKQAIYGFRGADVNTYFAACEAIVEGGGARVPLDTNFRSTARLITAYNRIFEPPFFSGPNRYDEPVHCGQPQRALVDAQGNDAAAIQLWQFVSGGKLNAPGIQAALGERMGREIRALLEGSVELVGADGKRRPLIASDIYVLTRNAKEGHALGEHLRQAGVPFAFYKQDGLFQTPEARQVRDLLAAIADPGERSKRKRAWLTPFFGLTLEELSLTDDLPSSDVLHQRLSTWKTLADAHAYEQLFSRILDESGIVRRALFEGEAERQLTNLHHLFEILLDEASRSRGPLSEGVLRLQAFIDETRLPAGENGNVQRLETERNAVQIMTLHKSKGLEAPVVFLAGGFTDPMSRGLSLFHEGHERCAWLGKCDDPQIAQAISDERAEEDQRLLYVALTRAGARLYLPFFAPGDFSRLGGAYKAFNERLVALRDADGAFPEGFALEQIPTDEVFEAAVDEVPTIAWTPIVPVDQTDEAERAKRLRAGHAGLRVTSYSQLKAESGESKEDFNVDREAGGVAGPGELPGGAASGIFIHALLEELPLASLEAGTTFDDWSARSEVAALVASLARRHGIDGEVLPHAQRLAFAGLSAPLVLAHGEALSGLGRAAQVQREVEFLFPIAERGFIKGFIDVLFEHQGRVYFADWKSDSLAAYGAEALGMHVARRYGLQVQLYSLAVARMLGIRTEAEHEARFGGSLYCFLRGMDSESTAGTYFERPSFAQLQAWEETLRQTALGEVA